MAIDIIKRVDMKEITKEIKNQLLRIGYHNKDKIFFILKYGFGYREREENKIRCIRPLGYKSFLSRNQLDWRPQLRGNSKKKQKRVFAKDERREEKKIIQKELEL